MPSFQEAYLWFFQYTKPGKGKDDPSFALSPQTYDRRAINAIALAPTKSDSQ